MTSTSNGSTRRIAAMVLTGAMLAGGVGLVVAQQAAAAAPSGTVAARSAEPEPPVQGENPDDKPVPFAPFVPFDGRQAGAFETALVPEGWKVLTTDDTHLVIGAPGVADPAFLLNKIYVSVGLGFPEREPAGTGSITEHDTGGSTVRIDLEDGNYLAVQFPATTGGSWTEEERMEFARGIKVVGPTSPVAG